MTLEKACYFKSLFFFFNDRDWPAAQKTFFHLSPEHEARLHFPDILVIGRGRVHGSSQ